MSQWGRPITPLRKVEIDELKLGTVVLQDHGLTARSTNPCPARDFTQKVACVLQGFGVQLFYRSTNFHGHPCITSNDDFTLQRIKFKLQGPTPQATPSDNALRAPRFICMSLILRKYYLLAYMYCLCRPALMNNVQQAIISLVLNKKNVSLSSKTFWDLRKLAQPWGLMLDSRMNANFQRLRKGFPWTCYSFVPHQLLL